MAVDLSGYAALITGAASGIGRASALAFASAGASVALVDIDAEGLADAAAAARAVGPRAEVLVADVRDLRAVTGAVGCAVEVFGRLDAALNNAGVPGPYVPLDEYSEEDFMQILQVDLGAVLSALGAGLGGVIVAARMMFAFGRDGLAARRLSGVSAATGVPGPALAAEMLIGLVLLTAFRLAGTSALNVFFYLATIGTLSLLVMYMLTNVAAAWHLGRRSLGQLAPPVAGVLIAGFVLYHNVWPVPPAPYEFFPYLVLGWLLAGLVLTVVIPGFAAKVDDGLERAAAG